MNFGEKLQKLRKEKGWSQEELAQRIDVSRQALSKWELDAAVPDTKNVLQLSKLFGVSTDYLLNDAYESDGDIPAVRKTNSELTKKYSGIMKNTVGGILSGLSVLGLLVLWLLSMFEPPVYSISVSGDGMAGTATTVQSGLFIFLERNHLEWLFAVCCVLFVIGLGVIFFPVICAKIKRRRKPEFYACPFCRQENSRPVEEQ